MIHLDTDLVERVLIVGVDTGRKPDFDRKMQELKSLAESCDYYVCGEMVQKLPEVNKALYIGSGKVDELVEAINALEVDKVIFDNDLSPSQIRNLSNELKVSVSDRTDLILDIFASRAKTKEAKLQVEMAKLQYILPRLSGMHTELGRQGGTSGSMSNKGRGEKKLELDKRAINKRIAELRRELDEISGNRDIQRKKRLSSRIPKVALVGYTNAGKSTVLNHMVEAYGEKGEKKVLEKDMLFATLDTNVRKIDSGDSKPFFLSDTVGFIDELPHGLIKAFRSTLEEVREADLLLHVVDFSDEAFKDHMNVTRATLKELDAGGIPEIICYNKVDLKEDVQIPKVAENSIYMSAGKDIGIADLCKLIEETCYGKMEECDFLIPYDCGSVSSYIMENAKVLSREYKEDGVIIKAMCLSQDKAKYEKYLLH